MLARVPWSPPVKEKPRPKRLGRDRRRHLVDSVAAIVRHGIEAGQPSRFWCEGLCRHDLRAVLCLEGWGWSDADAAAADVVTAALNQAGARRPSWKEGQPEHTQEGFSPIERTRCATCSGRLPEGHRLFCSPTCFEVKRHDRRHKWENAYDYAVKRETRWITVLGGTGGRR